MLRRALRLGPIHQAAAVPPPAAAMRFALHGHFMSGPTYKVGLMLSLCGEPFSFVLVDLRGGEHKKPDYLAINRYGQVPCLMDRGVALSQSPSILIHLADELGKFQGRTAEERARIREWMFWEHDKLAPGVFRSRTYKLGVYKAELQVVEAVRADGEAGLKVLDEWLAQHQWLVGERPTIGDIDVYGVVHLAPEGAFDLSRYPNVQAWMQRFEGLPGYASREALLPKQSRA
jgi:glutathione S-transferase